jgi:hypothetical protein
VKYNGLLSREQPDGLQARATHSTARPAGRFAETRVRVVV